MSSRLTTLARSIAGRGTDSRDLIPLGGIPKEVAPLVDAMNTLIARLETSVDRQRQFVDDAAHQLRTPLTALRLQIENLGSELGGHADRSRLADLELGARRSAALVDQLLCIARYDTASDQSRREHLDLAQLVKGCIADHVVLAEDRGVDIGIAAEQSGAILGSPEELQILFANLIDNAIRYTPATGVIDVGIRRLGGEMVVEIADTGSGIPDALMPRIFDRFVRAAPSDIEGTGLGLAIVKTIADRHGIGVILRNRQDRSGLIARVTFPATMTSPVGGTEDMSAMPGG